MTVFFPYLLSSSENTPRLFELPSLYVKYKSRCSGQSQPAWYQWRFLVPFAGGTTRKQKCTMFCSACQKFPPANFTFYAKEQTLTGTGVGLQVQSTLLQICPYMCVYLFAQICAQQRRVHRPQSPSWQCGWGSFCSSVSVFTVVVK